MNVCEDAEADADGGAGGGGADLKTRTPHNFVGKNNTNRESGRETKASMKIKTWDGETIGSLW